MFGRNLDIGPETACLVDVYVQDRMIGASSKGVTGVELHRHVWMCLGKSQQQLVQTECRPSLDSCGWLFVFRDG